MTHYGTDWDEVSCARLIKGINEGKSYGHMATVMSSVLGRDISRSAVAGKVRRLRDNGHDIAHNQHAHQTSAANKANAGVVERRIAREKRQKEKAMKEEEKVVRIRNTKTGQLSGYRPSSLDLTDTAKPLTELRRNECRAALGDGPVRKGDGVITPHLFCGQKTEDGQVYCAQHAEVMLAPKKPRNSDRFVLERLGLLR